MERVVLGRCEGNKYQVELVVRASIERVAVGKL